MASDAGTNSVYMRRCVSGLNTKSISGLCINIGMRLHLELRTLLFFFGVLCSIRGASPLHGKSGDPRVRPKAADVLEGTSKHTAMKHPPDAPGDGGAFKKYAVSTEAPVCSDVGVKIMKRGGNAMDAAVASTICVGVVNAFSSGIGGGGFMLVRKPGKGEDVVEMIDFRETAPMNLTTKSFHGDGDMTKLSGMSVAVPGEIKGLHLAHKKYGRLPWKELFAENIEIANEFEASEQLCRRVKKLETYILADEGLRRAYTRNGSLVEPGQKINRRNYARTLHQVAQDPDSFYFGDLANKIVEAVRANGGMMDKKDLATYKAISREPLVGKYRDYTVFTTNIPTSGLFIILALKVMEKFDLQEIARVAEETHQYPHYHLLVEIFKFMAAKRGELADPDFLPGWRELVSEIMSDKNAEAIAAKIDFNSVLNFGEYGRTADTSEDHGTTHINVVDEDEMIVMVTSTINLEFGAKFMDDDTGIIFNDQIDDFYVPNVKNAFDLDAMSKNILRPGKRPFSSAAPVIMMRDKEIIILGAAGGTRIPTSVFSVIFHIILGRSLMQAIMESRIHDQLIPPYTYIESNLDEKIVGYLRSLGHKIVTSSQNTIFTSVQGIKLTRLANGKKRIEAFSDKRKGGMSSGV